MSKCPMGTVLFGHFWTVEGVNILVIDKIKKINPIESDEKNEKASDMLVGKWLKCSNCKEILYKDNNIDQSQIDIITSLKISHNSINLPKGLNKRTLEKIIEFLKENSGKIWTLREIAYEIKISNVTIKKYMDYLESVDMLHVEATSGNVGRPELKYSLKT